MHVLFAHSCLLGFAAKGVSLASETEEQDGEGWASGY